MINKANVLGKHPEELGKKDAIHVAIVSVRAGSVIVPGQRCGLNEFNEAVPSDKGCGQSDPFLRKNILIGENFWLLLPQDVIPNVQHVWEHPKVEFALPTREIKRNRWLQEYADNLGITYDELMDACEAVVDKNGPVEYPATGKKSGGELSDILDDLEVHDIFSNWSDETGNEFSSQGTECCPEYDYPDRLFISPSNY